MTPGSCSLDLLGANCGQLDGPSEATDTAAEDPPENHWISNSDCFLAMAGPGPTFLVTVDIEHVARADYS